jgi:hypothetical protein
MSQYDDEHVLIIFIIGNLVSGYKILKIKQTCKGIFLAWFIFIVQNS